MTSSVRKPCPASIPARSLAPVSSSATAPKRRRLPLILTGMAERLAYRFEARVQAGQDGPARPAFDERQRARHRDLREDDRRHVLVLQVLDGRREQLVVRR